MGNDDVIDRIDDALKTMPAVGNGSPAYAPLLDRYARTLRRKGHAEALDELRAGVVDLASWEYGAVVANCELMEFEDRGVWFLFDGRKERTVLIHGITQAVAPNTRDSSYHAGYPRREGYDKGHGWSHAQGGFEGGPNYFYQRAAVNRRLSAVGHLWRDIETHLASNAGMFAFVRLIYRRSDKDTPSSVEYGILNGPQQFRAVIFPNR
ncbi:hypothetical protein [Arenibaculum pallidiluteum]|uniref:hypothetical protein n=1 Tax=Arenibaculum pallidiluteum TaxID=2812559 RepID=UPI001A97D15C|nr:hypothetical protein [Arenibaculum pallidiluteum]